MKKEEVNERQKHEDVRVFYAIEEAKKTDKSFTEVGLFGLPIKYTQEQCREFWFQSMALGIQEGLRIGSLQGQKIDLFNNCKDPRQQEFLEKIYKLSEEYNCSIVYHPQHGMCVMDLKN